MPQLAAGRPYSLGVPAPLAALQLKAGVLATPWLLLYGTSGAAWGSVDTTLSQSCLLGGCGSSITPLAVSSTITDTRLGWVAGAGVEAMLNDHWLLRGEWLHVDLGNFSNALSSIGIIGAQTTTWSRSEKFDEFRAALSYQSDLAFNLVHKGCDV
jgi:outer membrane immunogenic protein